MVLLIRVMWIPAFVKQLIIMLTTIPTTLGEQEGNALQHTKALMNIANMSEIHVDWIYSGAMTIGDVFNLSNVWQMKVVSIMVRKDLVLRIKQFATLYQSRAESHIISVMQVTLV